MINFGMRLNLQRFFLVRQSPWRGIFCVDLKSGNAFSRKKYGIQYMHGSTLVQKMFDYLCTVFFVLCWTACFPYPFFLLSIMDITKLEV